MLVIFPLHGLFSVFCHGLVCVKNPNTGDQRQDAACQRKKNIFKAAKIMKYQKRGKKNKTWGWKWRSERQRIRSDVTLLGSDSWNETRNVLQNKLQNQIKKTIYLFSVFLICSINVIPAPAVFSCGHWLNKFTLSADSSFVRCPHSVWCNSCLLCKCSHVQIFKQIF